MTRDYPGARASSPQPFPNGRAVAPRSVFNPPRVLAILSVAAALSGCITLLPKSPPAQLYRFGATGPATATPPTGARNFSVRDGPINFSAASAGDQILTVDGEKTAYIAGARWISSAAALFEAATDEAFAARSGPARLLARGETAHADYVLKLDVRRFEARYDHGAASAPTIVVQVYAALDDPSRPAAGHDHVFAAAAPASDNRVGAIVQAFDTALAAVLSDLTAWVDAKGEP